MCRKAKKMCAQNLTFGLAPFVEDHDMTSDSPKHKHYCNFSLGMIFTVVRNEINEIACRAIR